MAEVKEFQPKKKAVYCRVSTSEQDNKVQEVALSEYLDKRDLKSKDFDVFVDVASGLAEKRENLDRLMERVRAYAYDEVIIWCFSRLARSPKHMCGLLEEFKKYGVALTSVMERIDTSGPLGVAIVSVLTAFSKMEVDLIKERTCAGLRNARLKGRRLGRPRGVKDRCKRRIKGYREAWQRRKETQRINEKQGVFSSV